MRSAWVALGVLVTLAIITICLRRYELSALAVNHQAIRGWLDGSGLYTYRDPGTQTGTAVPPALAVLLAPIALLPLRSAGWLLALAGAVTLLLVTVVVAGPVARRHGRRCALVVPAVAALFLLAEPVRATLGQGRPELLVLALIVADLVALRRAAIVRSTVAQHPPGILRRLWTGGSWAGAGIGLAATLSATTLLFVIHLLITRQRRAAVTALATATTVTVVLLLVAPAETITWYGTTMWELNRPAPISDTGNQALAGVMARLYDFPAPPVLVWFSFGILLLAVGLIRARSAHREGDEVAAFTLIGLTITVTGPVSTAAECLWMLPAVLILADAGIRRRRSARLPRNARIAGTWFLVAAGTGYLTVLAAPDRMLAWNIPALTMILLVNVLPSRHASPPLPVTRPGPRRAAIPLPRGG
ncbi:MAG TPA: glycosyltransferase family 87 protein [Actinoplanes sp.]|nr:glycosyltransferase family 87 protein [Actinoplanes sp.]